jgi:hypothetical protein
MASLAQMAERGTVSPSNKMFFSKTVMLTKIKSNVMPRASVSSDGFFIFKAELRV